MPLAALVAFLLTLGGAFLLYTGRYPWDGGLLLVLGLSGLLRQLWRHEHLPHPLAELRHRARPSWRTVLRSLALALSLGVAVAHSRMPAGADFTLVFGIWLLACALFLVSLLPSRPWPRLDGTRRLSSGAGALLALLGLALLVRVVALETVPPIFSGDEGEMARAGYEWLAPPLDAPFRTGWLGNPSMTFIVLGIFERLFGATILGARLAPALIGTAAVLATLLLGRALGGPRVGWISALVVACWAYAIHYSRLAINNIADALLAPLAFWALWRALAGEARERPDLLRWWGAAGFVAGLGWYGYFGARWITAMLVLFLLWRWWREPYFWQRQKRGLLTLVIGWGVACGPIVYWFLLHPDDLISRYHQVSLFGSGLFADTVKLTGRPPVLVFLSYALKALGGFHVVPDPTFWYHPGTPLLDFVWGSLMLVGMIESFLHWRWPSRALTLLWFWSSLITAWVLTENPPSSQRGILLIPAVALLIAWGTEALLDLAGRYRRAARHLLYAALAAAAIFNLIFYFALYTPRRVYGNPTAEIATEVARYLREHPLPKGGKVYFLGEPYLYWEFGTLAYLLRDVPGENVPLETIPAIERPARLIIAAPRINEWAAVSRTYPDGTLVTLYAPVSGHVLALIYDLP